MELHCSNPPTGTGKELLLNEMIRELLDMKRLTFASNRTIVINDVPPDIYVHSESAYIRQLLTSVIDLLSLELKNGVTRISAKIYTDIVLIHIRENNFGDLSSVFEKLMQLVPQAEKCRGYLGINTLENGLVTIVLSILNQPQQAAMTNFERLAQLIATKSKMNLAS